MVVSVGLVAAACGGSEEGGTVSLEGESANDHGTQDVSEDTELELELDDFYFAPTVLTGTAGQELALELTNEGGEEHNFSLTDQTIDQDVEPDGTAQVTVTFPESGTLVFFCKYHDGQGMRGALRTG